MEKDFKSILDDINAGVIKKTKTICHVDYYLLEKTPYSFHLYAVYQFKNGKDVLIELLYDLRNKRYFIKKNGQEIKFNIVNLDRIIPRPKDNGYSNNGFYSRASADSFLKMVEVEENKGMYQAMLDAVGALGEERTDMTSRALIRLITSYNKLELIYKAGLDVDIVHHGEIRERVYMAGQRDVRKIHEIFGVTKAQFKFICDYANPKRDTYQFRDCIKDASYLEQKDMDTYRGYEKIITQLEEKYNIDGRYRTFVNNNGSLKSFIESIRRKKNNLTHQNTFYGFIQEYNFSNVPKLIEYLLFECLLSQGAEFSDALQHYRDYYRMCTDLEYERFDRYPKYLKTQHDIVSRNYKVVADEMTNKKFVQNTARYKYLEADLREFVVRVPAEIKDLVYEGNVLQHCVGSYCKKVAEGRTMIIFLREKKNPDVPLVTVEIREDKIVQVRGQANRLPTPEERAAVQRFAKRHSMAVSY